MLLAVGVKRERLIFQDPRSVSIFPRLYATSWPWVRTSPVRNLYDIYRRVPRRRTEWDGALVYLSRRNIRYRPLVNEEEIEALFLARGFRSVRPEQLDLETTIDVFSRPACVAGPYGSAYHNMVFSETKPFCFTVMPPFYQARWDEFVRWFGMMGFPLAYVRGEGGEQSTQATGSWQVPLERVERGLDQVMALLRQR
jgi:hypothetical protein